MAHQGVDRRAITPLDRLAYQGKRGLGGLELVNEALDLWPEFAQQAGLEADLAKAVASDFDSLRSGRGQHRGT